MGGSEMESRMSRACSAIWRQVIDVSELAGPIGLVEFADGG